MFLQTVSKQWSCCHSFLHHIISIEKAYAEVRSMVLICVRRSPDIDVMPHARAADAPRWLFRGIQHHPGQYRGHKEQFKAPGAVCLLLAAAIVQAMVHTDATPQ